ncbi:hypothetical protein H4N58_11040 [Mumia sp. ZJ1417]|uniref:hypothetical protein n=1 Tax=Mumia sp. ZJ1417 TaxID=2708082 RepID=UPI00141E5840|nr:hypothetical protein [Mumia sp. ZJ1417]QMW64786.1 hypothetical protein H4N58_11040 [Mumia sp. ZJ1417]
MQDTSGVGEVRIAECDRRREVVGEADRPVDDAEQVSGERDTSLLEHAVVQVVAATGAGRLHVGEQDQPRGTYGRG